MPVNRQPAYHANPAAPSPNLRYRHLYTLPSYRGSNQVYPPCALTRTEVEALLEGDTLVMGDILLVPTGDGGIAEIWVDAEEWEALPCCNPPAAATCPACHQPIVEWKV
jgi:hypothetical protein